MVKFCQIAQALYDYQAQGEGELSFPADSILYILDRASDPDWWLASLHQQLPPNTTIETLSTEEGIGRIPSNYVQEAPPALPTNYKASFSYQAQTDEELSFEEAELFLVYDHKTDPDWWLVRRLNTEELGLVPANYIQEVREEEALEAPSNVATMEQETQLSMSRQKSNSFSRKEMFLFQAIKQEQNEPFVDPLQAYATSQIPKTVEYVDDTEFDDPTSPQKTSSANRTAIAAGVPSVMSPVDQSEPQRFYAVTAIVKVGKKNKTRQGLLGVTNGVIFFVNEKDKSVIQQWQAADITKISREKKHLLLEFESLQYDFEGKKKSEIEELRKEIEEAKENFPSSTVTKSPPALSTAVATPPAVSRPTTETTQMFTPIHVAPIPAQSDPLEMPFQEARALYDYRPESGDELTILEGDRMFIVDEADPNWTKVQLVSDPSVIGFVPSTYIEKVKFSPIRKPIASPSVTQSIPPPPLPSRSVPTSPPTTSVPVPEPVVSQAPLPQLPMRNLESPPQIKSSEAAPSFQKPSGLSKAQELPPALPDRQINMTKTSPQISAESRAPVQASKTAPAPPTQSVPSRTEMAAVPKADKKEARPAMQPPDLPSRNSTTVTMNEPVKRNIEPEKVPVVKTKVEEEKVHVAPPSIKRPEGSKEVIPPETERPVMKKVTPVNLTPPALSETQAPPVVQPRPQHQVVTKPLTEKSSPTKTSPKLPDESKLREWTDKSGTFKVQAQYLKYVDGKVHLHKVNGVKIAVPLDKLCDADANFVTEALQTNQIDAPAIVSKAPPEPVKPSVTKPSPFIYNSFDWYGYCVGCGIATVDAETYAKSFVEEKMDASSISHMSRELLKDLKIPAGDIIRLMSKKDAAVRKLSGGSVPAASLTNALPPQNKAKPLAPETSVASLFADEEVQRKIMEAEKRAQQKNIERLDSLLANKVHSQESQQASHAFSLTPQTGGGSGHQQVKEDERLAMQLQENELRAAGAWRDRPPVQNSQSSPLQRPGRSADQQHPVPTWIEQFSNIPMQKQEPSPEPTSARPQPSARRISRTPTQAASNTVDVNVLFNAAKQVKQNDSPSFSETQPRSFSNVPSVMQQSASLPQPLLPVSTDIARLPVKVSTGDEQRPMIPGVSNQPVTMPVRNQNTPMLTVQPSVQQQPLASGPLIPQSSLTMANWQQTQNHHAPQNRTSVPIGQGIASQPTPTWAMATAQNPFPTNNGPSRHSMGMPQQMIPQHNMSQQPMLQSGGHMPLGPMPSIMQQPTQPSMSSFNSPYQQQPMIPNMTMMMPGMPQNQMQGMQFPQGHMQTPTPGPMFSHPNPQQQQPRPGWM